MQVITNKPLADRIREHHEAKRIKESAVASKQEELQRNAWLLGQARGEEWAHSADVEFLERLVELHAVAESKHDEPEGFVAVGRIQEMLREILPENCTGKAFARGAVRAYQRALAEEPAF